MYIISSILSLPPKDKYCISPPLGWGNELRGAAVIRQSDSASNLLPLLLDHVSQNGREKRSGQIQHFKKMFLTWISHRCTQYPPSWTSFLPPTPSHPAKLSQSTRLSSLSHAANSHWLSMLHMAMDIFQCYCLNSSFPPTPCPPTHSLYLHLYSCPANRFISAIFLHSLYLC